MNSSPTSALSEFSRGSLGVESPNEPRLHAAGRGLLTMARSWLGRAVPFALVPFVLIFSLGVAATLVWQSYGSAAREVVAGWSPHLGWLAPAAASAAVPSERLRATSLALAAVRQSVDKLTTEVNRLQAQGGPDKPTASPPSRPGSRRL